MRFYQRNFYYKFLIILMVGFLLPATFLLAENKVNLDSLNEKICGSPELIDQMCDKQLSKEDCRKLLEGCQEYLEKKREEIESDISKTQQEKKTLKNQIDSLDQKIKNLNYQIYQSNLGVKSLGFQIGDTESSIERTSEKIGEQKEKIGLILRAVYQEDQKTIWEILLSSDTLSDFFDNLVYLETLNTKNQELLTQIQDLKSYLEEQKTALEEETEGLKNLIIIREIQKKENSQVKKDRERYLGLTEAEYQKQLQEKEGIVKKAAEIRARIFELIGVAEAPTFGEAYEIAKYVESLTGIRPAFLLAVLQQESAIGKNVGQCYLSNSETGAGVIIKSGKVLSGVMKPTRDVGPFLIITKELGRDPYATPVSCPMSYGWGGAMGPAQFIPSTWMIYRDRLKAITGKPGDPWNIKDAFLASALYLTDYGAKERTYNGEWKAAMIYFSGTSRRTSYNGYGFYGDNVIEIAAQYQRELEILEKTK